MKFEVYFSCAKVKSRYGSKAVELCVKLFAKLFEFGPNLLAVALHNGGVESEVTFAVFEDKHHIIQELLHAVVQV